jgi:predicted nucleotidyltransferase
VQDDRVYLLTTGVKVTTQQEIRDVLARYRSELSRILGDTLDSVILYGSRARGDAEEASDIDVLCVMNEPFDYGELLRRTSELTAELSLAHDVVISRTFVTRQDYESRSTPFLMNVQKEGAVV